MQKSRSIRGVRRAPIALGTMFAAALCGAGMASAADPVQLQSRLGNWCLDAPNGNNTAAMVNPCDGSTSQRWTFSASGQLQSAAAPAACLTISNAADTTPVMLLACQADSDNQRWNHQPNGQITSPLGPCLNVDGGVAKPANPVIAYHCIPDVADEEWDGVPA